MYRWSWKELNRFLRIDHKEARCFYAVLLGRHPNNACSFRHLFSDHRGIMTGL